MLEFNSQVWYYGSTALKWCALDLVTQTRRAEIPGLRETFVPLYPPPAPCLHLTHPVFNPVSPTTHSLNASVARGDKKLSVL